MTAAVFYKLIAIFIAVGIGWFAGRMRWLGDERRGADPARTLSNIAFYVFIPALLFRTTSRLDFGALPWATMTGFFVPVLVLLLIVYAWERRRARDEPLPAAPSVRAISSVFGNTLQVGVPMAAALFGETGLGIHITIVSLHTLTLLTVLTALVEMDLARARARHEPHASALVTLKTTVRNTIVHPVVLPVLAGLLWNATGLGLPPVVDETLELLGSAVVPLCLVLIGMSLAYYGVRGSVRPAIVLSVLKLLLLPALVLVFARWGLGLTGLPLAVIVMMAALPIGTNALVFSQRYETLEGEATTAIVLSTVAFVATAPLWLAVLAML
jgi:hypothetical protein